jgi:hypothetical protein
LEVFSDALADRSENFGIPQVRDQRSKQKIDLRRGAVGDVEKTVI